MANRARARPIRVRQHSPALVCTVTRVVGYRAESDDGWRGPLRRRFYEASWDALERNEEKARV